MHEMVIISNGYTFIFRLLNQLLVIKLAPRAFTIKRTKIQCSFILTRSKVFLTNRFEFNNEDNNKN